MPCHIGARDQLFWVAFSPVLSLQPYRAPQRPAPHGHAARWA